MRCQKHATDQHITNLKKKYLKPLCVFSKIKPQFPLTKKTLINKSDTLSTQTTSELDVLLLDGDTLGVDGAQVSVLKEGDEVSFNGLLESTDSRGLESEISLEVLSNLTDETLEGKLADKQLSRLLVSSDFTESDGTGLISVGLLDTSSSRGGGGLSGGLSRNLLSGSLSGGGLSSDSRLGSGHCCERLESVNGLIMTKGGEPKYYIWFGKASISRALARIYQTVMCGPWGVYHILIESGLGLVIEQTRYII